MSSLLENAKGWKLNIPEVCDLPNIYILQSFAYARESHIQYYSQCKGFLMDSGAFTIMRAKKKNFDIINFAKKYGEFIKKNNIQDFFELDIDSVFPFEVYKDCLHILQDITGREPIRVFHEWRGLEYFEECCKKFEKMAIGGLVIGQNKTFFRNNLQYFTEMAKNNNCKLHGLGVTDPHIIRSCDFYSVDSSSWVSVGRFGTLYRFDGHNVKDYDLSRKNCPEGTQLEKTNGAKVVLKAWGDYCKYLEQF